MNLIAKKMVNFLKKEDGPTAVEYAVMLALIIVVCIAAITALGSSASQTFSYVNHFSDPIQLVAYLNSNKIRTIFFISLYLGC